MIGARTRFSLRGLLLGILVAVPVAADQAPGAPPGQYAVFVSGDRGIRDLKTGLVWERSVSIVPVNFVGAICGAGLRLPTLKELLTLVDEQFHLDYDVKQLQNVPKMIDPNAFGADTPVEKPYWTSSRDGTNKAWAVDFSTGETILSDTRDLGDTRYARCVHFQP